MARLTFHPLRIRRRGDDYIVSAEKEGKHLTIDEDGRAILEALQHTNIAGVEQRFPGHDVEGFIRRLQRAGLIHKRGHRVVSEHRTIARLADTPRSLAWAKSGLFESALLGLAAAAVLLMVAIPGLAPHPRWLLPVESLAATIPLAFLAWWLVTLWHEMGHYILIGRTGAPTHLAIVHKWHLLLPHADTRQARTLTHAQRIHAHLGGILFTLALITILDLLILYGVLPTAARFLAAIAFLDLLMQLTPLPRTDLTNAFEHATGTSELPRKLVRSACPFCKESPSEPVRRFLPAAIIGAVLLGTALFAYLLPWILHVIMGALRSIVSGAGGNATLFWDGAATLIILGIGLSLYAVATIREHERTESPTIAALAVIGFLFGNFLVAVVFAVAAMLYLGALGSTLTLFLVGLAFGALFLRLLDAIDIEGAGFAKDFFLPIAAASTGILLMVLATWLSAVTGTLHAETIHGLSYAAGMLAALVV